MSESARATPAIGDALSEARRKTQRPQPRPGPSGMLGLQRLAGNAAVNALMAAKTKAPGEEATGKIDSALTEMRGSDPVIATVEAGLKAAEAAGVPVQLEGPKPPASALAVTTTGFGPEAVAPPRPARPPKPVAPGNALGKASAKAGGAAHGGASRGGGAAGPPAASPGAVASAGATALSSDQLNQPPVPPSHIAPEHDPAFQQVAGGVKRVAADKRAHPPAASQAQQAQGAALAPSDDAAGQAKAAKVDTMDSQQAGSFDKKAFIAAVQAAIEAKSPKNLKEAETAAGKADSVKGEVKGLVSQGKQNQTKDIEGATEAAPDTSKAVAKPVTPMTPDTQGAAPAVPGAGAAPKPAPPEQVNLEAGKQQANQEMADANVSQEQLAQSNEPQFQKALADKQEAAAHADTAPGEFRAEEQQVIADSKAQAAAETQTGVAGMQATKAGALGKLTADKGATKSKDEAERARITARVQEIYAKTETEVKKTLDGIDPEVERLFNEGEAAAKQSFEAYVAQKMSAYKADRYGGWLGGLRWAKDQLLDMPEEVNRFYEAGRELYLQKMDGVISRVADFVGNSLSTAKRQIAQGKSDIASFVATLAPNLRSLGAEAAKEIGDKFEQLESDVNAKQDSVVDTLATKYVESRMGLDERIEALQEENKGLVGKAIDGIKGVINTIRQLAAMLMNTLARVSHVVGDIIKKPVQFLGNLVAGVKGGIMKFKDNILEHLKKGLTGWLFGALAEGGVEVPEKFDLQGIIKLLISLFGLTWNNIRNRLVKQIGEKAMGAVEKGVDIFQKIASGGVGALWQMMVDKLSDIKETIMSQIKEFVVTKIIMAGVGWLIGLLNPAAAFIKACKLIYDVIMFFVTNGERIMKFVNTVIDSAADVLAGNIGGVVGKIENVLGQMVPILIGFLASVLGLGGIGQKIREILEKLQKPVNKALDFVIKQGLKIAAPIIRLAKGIGGKVKAGFEKGKKYVKGTAEKIKSKFGRKSQTPANKEGEPASATQKEQIRAQVAKSVPSGGVKPSELSNSLQGVYGRLKDKGLHGISLRRAKGKAGAFDVLVTCSPPVPVAQALADMHLKIDDLSFKERTTCVAYVNGQPFVARSSGRQGHKHAEQKCLSKINKKWGSLVGQHPGPVEVVLQVTRSPCADCSLAISTFKQLKEAGSKSAKTADAARPVNLTIQVASIYEGKSRHDDQSTASGGQSIVDLVELRDVYKAKIEPWDVLGALKKRLGRDVTEEDLGAETRNKLAQKVTNVNEELEQLGLIRIGRPR